jgi:hypothetical protein
MIFLHEWLEDNYTGQIKGKAKNFYLGDQTGMEDEISWQVVLPFPSSLVVP